MSVSYQEGAEFYDFSDTFEKYIRHRQNPNNPNELIEKPIIKELAGQIKGNILDLGCGYGDLAEFYIAQGGNSYLGIDSSDKMIRWGNTCLNHPNIQLAHADIEKWEFGREDYNWVISRLVFHYIKELDNLFKKIYTSLQRGGFLLFSVEHPLRTSSMHLSHPKGKKKNWLVDQYFEMGERQQVWLDQKVIKYHRTIEEYLRLLNKYGFRLVDLKEGCPKVSFFKSQEEYERRKRIPLFLIIKAVKLAT